MQRRVGRFFLPMHFVTNSQRNPQPEHRSPEANRPQFLRCGYFAVGERHQSSCERNKPRARFLNHVQHFSQFSNNCSGRACNSATVLLLEHWCFSSAFTEFSAFQHLTHGQCFCKRQECAHRRKPQTVPKLAVCQARASSRSASKVARRARAVAQCWLNACHPYAAPSRCFQSTPLNQLQLLCKLCEANFSKVSSGSPILLVYLSPGPGMGRDLIAQSPQRASCNNRIELCSTSALHSMAPRSRHGLMNVSVNLPDEIINLLCQFEQPATPTDLVHIHERWELVVLLLCFFLC